MNKTCSTCRHWTRGTVIKYAADLNTADGKPHGKQGKTEIEYDRDKWHGIKPGQDIGTCAASQEHVWEKRHKPMMIATCYSEGIFGELLTDAEFGCTLYDKADPLFDQLNHLTIDNRPFLRKVSG